MVAKATLTCWSWWAKQKIRYAEELSFKLNRSFQPSNPPNMLLTPSYTWPLTLPKHKLYWVDNLSMAYLRDKLVVFIIWTRSINRSFTIPDLSTYLKTKTICSFSELFLNPSTHIRKTSSPSFSNIFFNTSSLHNNDSFLFGLMEHLANWLLSEALLNITLEIFFIYYTNNFKDYEISFIKGLSNSSLPRKGNSPLNYY